MKIEVYIVISLKNDVPNAFTSLKQACEFAQFSYNTVVKVFDFIYSKGEYTIHKVKLNKIPGRGRSLY